MAYLIDTNVFINAKNEYYAFEFCPAFWEWLKHCNEKYTIFSIEKVWEEIEAGNDELVQWTEQCDDNFFLKLTPKIFKNYDSVRKWAERNFKTNQVRTFLGAADAYLIAYAMGTEHTIVTLEKHGSKKKKITIPQACKQWKIECISPFEMLKRKNQSLFWVEIERFGLPSYV